MGALEANTTLIYGVHIRESANDGSDFTNAAADYRVLFLGEDGQLHVKDSSGAVSDIGVGGLAHSQVGYTTIGGSFDGTRQTSIEKITLAVDALVTSIVAYIKGDGTNPGLLTAMIYDNNAGAPRNLIVPPAAQLDAAPTRLNSVELNSTGRWVSFGIGRWLAAGDYWAGVNILAGNTNHLQIAYDSGGSGYHGTVADLSGDSSEKTLTSDSRHYSIYFDILS